MAYSVSLAGVPLSGDEPIVWPFTRGGDSPEVPLLVTNNVHQQLSTAAGDMSLRFKGPDVDLSVDRISILRQEQAVNGFQIRYILGDRRTRLRGVRVTDLFNGVRRVNEKFISQLRGRIDPNIAQFSQHPRLTYLPHTTRQRSIPRSSSNQKFATGIDTDFEPWTVLTALRYLLSDEFLKGRDVTEFDGSTPFRFGFVDFSGATEKKILLKNFRPNVFWPKAIDSLLLRGRYSLFVDDDGGFVVRDIEPIDSIFNGFGKYQGAGGIPIQNDRRREAPKKAKIHFARRWEVRFDYSESLHFNEDRAQRAKNKKVKRILTNVYKMPQKIDKDKGPGAAAAGLGGGAGAAASGTGFWQKGQWVPFKDALAAFDQDRIVNPGFHQPNALWSLENIRKYFLHASLGHFYSLDPNRPGFKNDILEARVAGIYQYFRQNFQIPPQLLDLIVDLDSTSIEIIDTGTGRRQPQPVACDYTSWDSLLYHRVRKSGQEGNGAIRPNLIWHPTSSPLVPVTRIMNSNLKRSIAEYNRLRTDVSGIKFQDLNISPASISIVDGVLGIIRLEFTRDLSGETIQYDPVIVDPETIPTGKYVRKARKFFTREMEVLDTWRLAVKLTMKFRSNNEESKFFEILGDANQFGIKRAQGGPTTVFFPGLEAWQAWDQKQELVIDGDKNQLKIKNADDPLNEGVLKDAAQAELQKLYFPFQNRILGVYAAKGWRGDMPRGQAKTVRASFQNGKFETVLGARGEPPAPRIWEFINPVTRDFLGRFIEGTFIE